MKDLSSSQAGGARTDPRSGPHVLIVGGGASGVLMAAQLLSRPERAFRVTVIEGRNMLGCGVAYSTNDPDHLLNTRVHNMSAYPDKPHHFHDWLRTRPEGAGITDQCFVSRATYGTYMANLLRPWSGTGAGSDDQGRLRCVRQTCLRVEETARGVAASLADGQTLIGDILILATGHVQPEPDPNSALSGAWQPLDAVDPDGRIVIVGSGLSMVDQVLSLLKSGHRGEILSISRRGLLPRSHAATRPVTLGLGDIPLGAPLSVLLAWARNLAADAVAQGGSWRDAVDGIRPHVHSIWRGLPPVEKARFLRHASTWWDVHRHRIPPESEQRIQAALASGQLVLRRATFLGAEREGDGTHCVEIRPNGEDKTIRPAAARVIDCRGIGRDPEHNATPMVAALLASGQVRVDALRISLDVDLDCRLIDKTGKSSGRLHAIGPASRAAFWEITAIPDIRDQVARLASALAVA